MAAHPHTIRAKRLTPSLGNLGSSFTPGSAGGTARQPLSVAPPPTLPAMPMPMMPMQGAPMAVKKSMPPAMKAKMESMIDKGKSEKSETPKMKAAEKRKGMK